MQREQTLIVASRTAAIGQVLSFVSDCYMVLNLALLPSLLFATCLPTPAGCGLTP